MLIDPLEEEAYWHERLSSPPPQHQLWGYMHFRAQLTQSILESPVAAGREISCPWEAGLIARQILAGTYEPPKPTPAPETEPCA